MFSTQTKPCVAVSSCLLGQSVRYDGEHKYNQYIAQTLSKHFELLPLCPEVAVGLGIPRPAIQLLQTSRGVHAVRVNDPEYDVTEALQDYAKKIANDYGQLCGYVFKSRSPSCGVKDVPVISHRQIPGGIGTGIFTAMLTRRLPLLPVITETDLEYLHKRQEFIDQVFGYQRQHHLIRADSGRSLGQ